MSAIDLPTIGTLALCALLVCTGYTFAVAVAAGRGRPHLLGAARAGTYATCGFVALAVFTLAYAFQAHAFQIRYVARYSDRSMPWWYLWTALWGGQDGSLLWWTFILSVWTLLVTRWLKGRYPELQPYILATLMSIFGFFGLLMLFAANPFAVTPAAVPPDGEGLNPLLQNYWMAIHPPTLYNGLVGWSVPFSFVMAALITGRLNEEWIHAARKWALAAWTFLAFGNLLGALWSYEELGWGGYWAWDPVENASFMPMLVGTAYLHSVMIQERRGMLKVWNVFLLALTFIMTIFGTFLTRSGLIASVHSFAKSDIGIYFAWYLVFLFVVVFGTIVYRLPLLRAEARIDSMLSREFAFLLQNWVLLGMMLFVAGSTTAPLISEWLSGETITVGEGWYNAWMVPFGLLLMLLTGVGPLIAWRRATGRNLVRAFLWPTVAAVVALLAQVLLGPAVGFPPYVRTEAIFDSRAGAVLAGLKGTFPGLSVLLCVFVMGTIVQEFWRGVAVRRRNAGEGVAVALVELVARAKRRYGGYVVHAGLVLMYLGFTGAAYDIEKEAALRPGKSMTVGHYTVRYDGPRTERDVSKAMRFADMTIFDEDGTELARMSPAKFVYRTHPEMPTTEVAIRSTLRDDLYLIMSTINPQTQLGTFRVVVRPFVSWIWIGGLLMLLGAFIAISPSVKELLAVAAWRSPGGGLRPAFTTLLFTLLAVGLVAACGVARAQDSSSLMAGTVEMKTPEERQLFERLLCQCGDCPRLPLSTCGCGWAEEARAELRQDLAGGKTVAQIQAEFRETYGARAIAIPADEGLGRALWVLPIGAFVLAAGGLVVLGRRWAARGALATAAEAAAAPAGERDAFDDALDEELKRFDD